MMLFTSIQIRCVKSLGLSACVLLGACDSSTQSKENAFNQSTSNAITAVSTTDDQQVEQAKSLTQVAGRTASPHISEQEINSKVQKNIPKNAEKFVGRYHVIVDCHEKFSLCEQGKAEFVINLLKDGTSHRTIIFLGKMGYEKNANSSNRISQENTWKYNAETHQIEVDRGEGVKFYYGVNGKGDLVIDLDHIYADNKIENGQFVDGSSVPSQEYVLKKFTSKEDK